MCGFCGYINKNDSITNDNIINSMMNSIIKHGPNDKNVFVNKNFVLGHTGLSIIDEKKVNNH